MNVLCIGAWIVGLRVAEKVLDAFLAAEFSTAEEFRRRVHKLSLLESGLTMPIDLGFDAAGTLYVLEFSDGRQPNQPYAAGSGRLLKNRSFDHFLCWLPGATG